MRETVWSPGADGTGRGRSRGWQRTLWTFCACLSTTAGVLYLIATWGLASVITCVILMGALAAILASAVWGGDGRRAVPKIASVAITSGLVAAAAIGLMSSLGLAGALIVLILAATAPGLTAFVRARWFAPQDRSTMKGEPVTPAGGQVVSRDIGITERRELPRDLSSLDDYTLCLAWRRSFLMLEACRTATERLSIVEQRQKYLDELHRRSPDGLAAWFASGARASGNPLPYVGKPPPLTDDDPDDPTRNG